MTNCFTVTGRIIGLEEKQTAAGKPFYIVDLETFYGSNVRFQAWDEAYVFICQNQLKAGTETDKEGDYLEVDGFMCCYNLNTKYGQTEYTTFKSINVRRPNARVEISGVFMEIKQSVIIPGLISFYFQPDIKVDNETYAKSIECYISSQYEEQLKNMKEHQQCIICGIVDNSNKRNTRIIVDYLEVV